MAKHVKFPKIGQFRNTVTDIKHRARFDGLDEQDQPKYNNDKLPTITFTGTVKLHGTNAGVCIQGDELWVQSRNEVVTTGHFGFAGFVHNNEMDFRKLLNQIRADYNIPNDYTVAVYGEWAGPGIQKGVGISSIKEKSFFIFGVKVAPNDDEEDNYWIDEKPYTSDNPYIHNINNFPTFEKEIDFSEPKMVVNELIDITEAVEKECPVAKALGIDNGLGEGIVWSGNFKGHNYRFKVKGEKHSATKVKKLASVDPEKLANIKETVEYLVTEQRLDQAIQETGSELDRKYTGDIMRWLAKDIMSEETDTLNANSLEWKDIASRVTGEYRRIFFQRIDDNL
jgi:hypothetical protein